MAGCSGLSKKQKQDKELEKLATEVMEVHDRSMPNIVELLKLKKKLISAHDNHMHMYENANENDSLVRTETMKAALDLEEADKSMMDWMHTYKAPDDFLPFEEKKAYYIKQKKIIENVESFMNETMNRAKEIIAKYSEQ